MEVVNVIVAAVLMLGEDTDGGREVEKEMGTAMLALSMVLACVCFAMKDKRVAYLGDIVVMFVGKG